MLEPYDPTSLQTQTNVIDERPDTIDPRTGIKINKYNVLCNKNANNNLFQNFTTNSKMNARQHGATIRVLQNRSVGKKRELTVSEKMDLEVYFSIYERRQNERKLYLDFVRQHFFSHCVNRCQNVKPTLNELIIAKRAIQLEKLQHRLHRTYEIVTAILLNVNTLNKISIHLERIVENTATTTICQYAKSLLQPHMRQTFQCMTKMLQKPDKISSSSAVLAKLAIDHQAHFAISMSTLCALLDYSVNSRNNWTIPVIVRQSEYDMKTIVLNKPLVEQYLSAKQRNEKAYKWRVKASLRSAEMYENATEKISNVDDAFGRDYKLYEFNEYLSMFANKSDGPEAQPNNSHKDNYLSTLWILKNGECNDTVRLLVRTKLVAVDTIDEKPVFVNFSTKVEYQVEFGAEQVTASELVREWCRHKFCPDSITERCKFDLLLCVYGKNCG